MRTHLILALCVSVAPAAVQAAEPCTATVLVDISESELSASPRKNSKIDKMTQFTKMQGSWYYCRRKGPCYSAFTKVAGKNIRTIKLNNCYIDWRDPDRSGGDELYGLRIIRSKFSTSELRALDLADALVMRGIDSNEADNFGRMYAAHPNGQCGTLARRALKGDKSAIRVVSSRELKDDGHFINPCIDEDVTSL